MSVPYGPILIVEDIPNILELLQVTLEYKGYPVITARNGDEALDAVQTERPALIMTDILMPKLDGFSLAYQVRSQPKTRDIPIIFISATYVSQEDKSFALSLGAVTFLEKPVEPEELLLTVAETLLGQGLGIHKEPMGEAEFRKGHRKRLEEKLKQKQTQIDRAKVLLEKVDDAQRPPIEALLAQAQEQYDSIGEELEEMAQSGNSTG